MTRRMGAVVFLIFVGAAVVCLIMALTKTYCANTNLAVEIICENDFQAWNSAALFLALCGAVVTRIMRLFHV